MKFPRTVALTALFALLNSAPAAWPAAGPEPEVEAKDLPRTPAVEPEHALETFRIKPGYRLELVAAEPLVADPIALAFDEQGRLFVVEMRDYSERRAERLGRIRMLEDTDGDGRFDKSTVYADSLPWPTAVICYNGGVFVGSTPDILYLKDTNGDGVADRRDVVFTGFGSGVERLNVQQLLNSFAWGLDNRIHGANGGNGGSIHSPRRPSEKPVELRGRDFSFDPRTLDFRAESGGGQYGMSFDDHGRKFVCSNSSHIRLVMYEDRYAGHNPYLTMPPPALDIAVDGPAAEVYRISPDEPWRVIRTKWRVAGLVPGPIEGGGRPSGYFTSATGITIYRGDAMPELEGDAFVADCGSNLVHHKKLAPDGVALKAQRPVDEEKVEFLASRDLWFRPVQMANAPDGTLYVIDMYREVIEHPWSFPASIKKYLDLNSGNDRGRLYRVVPEGFRQPMAHWPARASGPELVAMLADRNGWHRDTAARLLYERQETAAIPELRQLLASSKSPLARMHALHALAGLGGLAGAEVIEALADPAAEVRAQAIRLSELFSDEPSWQRPMAEELGKLATDPDPLVRYQLAFTLGIVPTPNRPELLARIIRQNPEDTWMQLAALTSLRSGASEFLNSLLQDRSFVDAPASESCLQRLMTMIGVRHEPAEVRQALATLTELRRDQLVCALAGALGEGLQRAGTSLGRLADAPTLNSLLERARALAHADTAPLPARLAAIRLLGQGSWSTVRDSLLSMLQPGQPALVQKASIQALAGFAEPGIAADLLAGWDGLTPGSRSDVVDVLLRRPERIEGLVSALETGRLHRTDLSASQVNLLRKQPQPEMQARTAKVLGQAPTGSRPEVVRAYASALSLSGQAEHGRAIYLERCASCHRLAGQGHALGPDLETVRSSGKETVLGNILDPNREVMPKYVNYLAETKDGESLTGLVAVENDSNVVLRQPNGNEVTLLRNRIESLRSLGQSIMPEGLEEGLNAQDVADLLEYILSAKPQP